MHKIKLLLNNKYSSNLLWTFFDKMFSLVNTLIIGILLARYLGPNKFGVLTYSQSYVALFGFLISLGLDSITVKEIVKRPSISNIIVSTSFILKLFSFCVVIFFINSISYIRNDTDEVKLIVFIISLGLIQQPFNVIVNYFQAIVDVKNISLFVMISKILLIIIKLFMIHVKVSLVGFVILDSLVFLFLSCSYLFYYTSYRELKIRSLFFFNKKIAITMLRLSWPLMLSSGAIVLYMRIDQIMIKEMLSLSDLGNYAVSVKISESWYFIPMIITSVFFPSIVKAKKDNAKLYYMRIKQLFFTTMWIGIFFAVFFTFFSDGLINLLFGNKFNGNNNVLPILAISGIFVSMGYVNGKWVVIENFTKIELIRNLLGGILNILLNFLFIPVYGINGAAISTLVSIFVASNLFFIFNKKTRKMFFIQNLAIFNFNLLRKK